MLRTIKEARTAGRPEEPTRDNSWIGPQPTVLRYTSVTPAGLPASVREVIHAANRRPE